MNKKSLPNAAIAGLVLFLFNSCLEPNEDSPHRKGLAIAFGSCNRQDLPQPLWPEILAEGPDVWIWLGDNIYADTDVIDSIVTKYEVLSQNEDYQKLASTTEVIGTWDDHDYGLNDGGKEYALKKQSQDAFLDFFNVGLNDPRRSREGVYAAHTFKIDSKKVKVILLDSRYFRDSAYKENDTYTPNETGTILGDQQWEWLKMELTNSDAQVHLIANGIQVIAEDHRFEKWSNFPNERERLFDLIVETKAPGVILLTGDRHIAEVSEITMPQIPYPIRDVTSSGLTHSYEEAADEPNRHRISPLIGMKNFGVMRFSEIDENVVIDLELKGEADTTFYTVRWTY